MSSSPPLVVADRYRLVAPLGQGGMGRVWRATDVVLHRDVAIKELVPPPGLTPGERQEMRERSLREARAIARLNNINVVRVFDVLRTDADPWIVMEYVPSRSLQDTLATDGPFSPVRAAEIGLGVLGALRAAHRAGVVHRDVKPGNVLIGADGRVVLTDFGLATVPGDPNVTRTGLVLGSPAYIAPERARDGTSGPAADLWSLGATLYAAVEGASPFARPSAIATLAALATENPPPARNAGPLKPVLNGLLRKDPTHRINAEEAERLLLRATGRRSKLTFPMSPTMRRPGVGRERPSLPSGPSGPPVLPGSSGAGAAPVVPGPRPPVAPARPVSPPGRTPVSGGRPAAGDGRPPVYVPGKAPVGRPSAETPTRVDGPKADAPRLDATRVDTPPVRDGGDNKTSKLFGTRQGPPTAPGPASGTEPATRDASRGALSKTTRGEYGTLTAADVAANRRRKAAPEHETSLADATALVPRPAGEKSQTSAPTAVDAFAPVDAPGTGRAPDAPGSGDAPTAVDAPTPTNRAAARNASTAVASPAINTGAPSDAPAASPARKSVEASVANASTPADVAAPSTRPGSTESGAPSAPGRDASTVAGRDASDVAGREARTAGTPGKSTSSGAGALDGSAPAQPAKTTSDAGVTRDGAATSDDVGTQAPSTKATRASKRAAGVGAESASTGAGTSSASATGGTGDKESSTSLRRTAPAKTSPASTTKPTGPDTSEAGTKAAADAPTADESAPDTSAPDAAAADESTTGARATDASTAGAAVAGVAVAGAAVAGVAVAGAAAAAAARTASPAANRTPAATESVAASPTTADAAAKTGSKTPTEAAEAETVTDEAVRDESAKGDSAEDDSAKDEKARDRSTGDQPGTGGSAADNDAAAAKPDAEPHATRGTSDDAPTAWKSPHGRKKTRSRGATAKAESKTAAARAPDRKVATASFGTAAGAVTDKPQEIGPAQVAVPLARTAPMSTVTDAPAPGNGPAEAPSSGAPTTGAPTTVAPVSGAPTTAAPVSGAPISAVPISGAPGARVRPSGDPLSEDESAARPRINRSTRPAWTPMQVGAAPRKTGGVTLFGTRLTYRQAAIGAGVLLLVLVLLIVLATKAFGGSGDDDPAASPTPPTAAATTTAATTAPTSATPTTTAPSTQPSSAPPTSAAPSSAPAATGGNVSLPAGWTMYRDGTGFTVPIWSGASIERRGTEVYFRKDNRLLIVDQTDQPKPDPVADWKQQEQARAGSAYRNYHKIRIERVNYFRSAADWEFTYTTSSGNDQHAVKRGVVVNDHQAYGLSWYTSPGDWNAAQQDLRLIYQGFRPKQ
jgi:serine/threonine protein kinase